MKEKNYGKADFKIKCDNLNSEKISDKILKIYEDSKIKFKDKNKKYSTLIGENIIEF